MVMCKGNQKFTQTNQMKHKYEKKDKKTSYIYMFPKGADQPISKECFICLVST